MTFAKPQRLITTCNFMRKTKGKSNSSLIIIRTAFTILMIDSALFALTAMVCWTLSSLSWNSFFSALFFTGLPTCVGGLFFAFDRNLERFGVFFSLTETGRISKGSPVGLYIGLAGFVAVITSIMIQLLLPR